MNYSFPLLNSLLNGETLSLEYKRDQHQQNNQSVPLPDSVIAEVLMAIGNARGGIERSGDERLYSS